MSYTKSKLQRPQIVPCGSHVHSAAYVSISLPMAESAVVTGPCGPQSPEYEPPDPLQERVADLCGHQHTCRGQEPPQPHGLAVTLALGLLPRSVPRSLLSACQTEPLNKGLVFRRRELLF